MLFIKKNRIFISTFVCVFCLALISLSGCIPKKKIAQPSENSVSALTKNKSGQLSESNKEKISIQTEANATIPLAPLVPSHEDVGVKNEQLEPSEKVYYESIGPKSVPGEDRHAVAVPVVTGFVGNVPPESLAPQPLPESILTPEQAEPIPDQPDAALTDVGITGAKGE